MKEIWRPVKNYEGLYEVSNYGNVRGLDRIETLSNGVKRSRKGSMLKAIKDRYGYLRIQLWKSGEEKKVSIHRLVAQAFIPNPNNLPQVNHKDEVKTNNHVENLEWCTSLYNLTYGTRLKHQVEKQSMPVLQLDINTEQVISEYPSTMEAERQLNIHSSGISECCRGIRKTYKGFKWLYKK